VSADLVLVTRKFRKTIPAAHRASLDTRINWLWNQRFGTVQMIWQSSPDVLDVTAATLILQAIMAKDLDSITMIFNRIEGGSLEDSVQAERVEKTMRL
jgi:hypothetical protein